MENVGVVPLSPELHSHRLHSTPDSDCGRTSRTPRNSERTAPSTTDSFQVNRRNRYRCLVALGSTLHAALSSLRDLDFFGELTVTIYGCQTRSIREVSIGVASRDAEFVRWGGSMTH